jgi:hypothetical protein
MLARMIKMVRNSVNPVWFTLFGYGPAFAGPVALAVAVGRPQSVHDFVSLRIGRGPHTVDIVPGTPANVGVMPLSDQPIAELLCLIRVTCDLDLIGLDFAEVHVCVPFVAVQYVIYKSFPLWRQLKKIEK